MNYELLSKVILLLVVVLVIYLPTTNEYNDTIYDLLSNKINLILVLILIGMVGYLDIKIGIMLVLLTLILLTKNKNVEGFQSNEEVRKAIDILQNVLDESSNKNVNSENKNTQDSEEEMNLNTENTQDSDEEMNLNTENTQDSDEVMNLNTENTQDSDEVMNLNTENQMENNNSSESFQSTNSEENEIDSEMNNINDVDESIKYCRGFSQEMCPPECSPLDCQPEKEDLIENFPRDTVPLNPKRKRVLEGFASNSQDIKGSLETQNNLNYKNRPDLDIQGCRLDKRNSDLNYTNFGPPLASCTAFNKTTFDNTGTFFYPLN